MSEPADSADPTIDLAAAYSARSPEDHRGLYAAWATTYDSDFLATHGYVYHESVVAALLDRGHPPGPVLDVGCGTGVVGAELRRRGVAVVDGIDISPEMLTVAATKTIDDGDEPVYRNLITADLTATIPIVQSSYAAVVSAGTFTHGHLGPEPIAELLRVAAPAAIFALGVNADHFAVSGFDAWFHNAIEQAWVRDFEIVERPIYDASRYQAADAAEHSATLSSVAVFEAGSSAFL